MDKNITIRKEDFLKLMDKSKIEVLVIAKSMYVEGLVTAVVWLLDNGQRYMKQVKITKVINNHGGGTAAGYMYITLESNK